MVCLNLSCLKGRQTPTPTVSVQVPVPVQTTNRLSNMSTKGGAHNEEGSVSDSVGEKKNKFLCSFGGKILPRPSDGQLVYAGGDTRVIGVPRSITFSELKRKIEETYKTSRLIIKYRILPEDLDALVTVASDDDMAYLWDENDKLASQNGNPNFTPRLLRLFIFQKSPKSPPQITTAQNYLDAINCRPSSKFDTSGTRHMEHSQLHRVMSTPNLTCRTQCGGAHQNQRQGLQPCGHPCGGMEAPVVRRGSYQNLSTAACRSSHGPGLQNRNVNGSKMVQNLVCNSGAFGSMYGKYVQEAGPSGGTPGGKQQSRAGTQVLKPDIWD